MTIPKAVEATRKEKNMGKRIAVSVLDREKGADAGIDPRFGRASGFIILDEDSGEILESLENTNVNAAHGAGTGTASMMSENKVDVAISCRFGPKAFQALKAMGIGIYTAPEGKTVSQVLEMYKKGELEPMEIKQFR